MYSDFSTSFDILQDIKCSTKRPPVVAGGKQGADVVYLEYILVTPIDPADAEIASRAGLATPFNTWSTFTKEQDIKIGDTLVYGERQFKIKSVFPGVFWGAGDNWNHLIMEELQAS
jgi:hypothetical protein